jgi:hypothetical protein
LFRKLWTDLVFFCGHLHLTDKFPGFAIGEREKFIAFDEITRECIPNIQFGDIGLHRDWGYLDNLVIPGFMKHAWIHTEDGTADPRIVEAVSAGVLHRSSFVPIYSDYAMVLRPKGVTEEQRKGACLKAKQIIGDRYDVNFKFDIEKEIEFYSGKEKDQALNDLNLAAEQLKNYHPAFSCTEVVGYCWWHMRELLRIYRIEHLGKKILIADEYINRSWEIIWASKSCTVKAAQEMGLHEEGVSMIEDYWKTHDVSG